MSVCPLKVIKSHGRLDHDEQICIYHSICQQNKIYLNDSNGQSEPPVNVVVSNVEISCSKHHPIPGETGVTRQEAESRLLQSVIQLCCVREELAVANTGEVLHQLRSVQAATVYVRLTDGDEVRPQSAS